MSHLSHQLRHIFAGVVDRLHGSLAPLFPRLSGDAVGDGELRRPTSSSLHSRLQPLIAIDPVENGATGLVGQHEKSVEHSLSKLTLNQVLELRGYPSIRHVIDPDLNERLAARIRAIQARRGAQSESGAAA